MSNEPRVGFVPTLANARSARSVPEGRDTHPRVFLRKSLESLENKGVEEMEVAKEFVRI